jgi:hypothetical protein
MAPRSGRQERPRKATFVFRGTIKKLKSATMKNVRPDRRTAVVNVQDVIESTAPLAHLGGQDITVRLSAGSRTTVGRTLTFHTIPIMFGDSLVTESIKEDPAPATRRAALAAEHDPVARKASRDVQDRLARADTVISGRVAAVKLPAEVAKTRRAATTATDVGPRRPVSEHDPKWRDAIVDVDDVHKGARVRNTVTIRFPASMDVRWYRAPKFQPGQQGFFLLHKTKAQYVSAGPMRAARGAKIKKAAAPGGEVYTALHPADFQPYGQAHVLSASLGTKTVKPIPEP